MNINKININQTEPTYYIASDIYDVSYHNNDTTFESLQSLLSSDNLSTLIPTAVRCGGMTIRFVQSSTNKYVQYRLMSDSFNTTVANWQGADDVPTAGSDNLVKSGGVKTAIDELGAYVYNIELENGLMFEYDSSTLNVGSTLVISQRREVVTFSSIKISLSKGDTIYSKTFGGAANRNYVITSTSNVILAVGAWGLSNFEYTMPQDGFAYINNNNPENPNPVVCHYYNFQESLNNRLKDISDDNKKNVSDLQKEVYEIKLDEGLGYGFDTDNLKVGDTISVERVANVSYDSKKIKVKSGDIIISKTFGGHSSRNYVITDNDNVIVAVGDFGLSNLKYIVEYDGYAYFNNNNSQYSTPSIVHVYKLQEKFKEYVETKSIKEEYGNGEKQLLSQKFLTKKLQNVIDGNIILDETVSEAGILRNVSIQKGMLYKVSAITEDNVLVYIDFRNEGTSPMEQQLLIINTYGNSFGYFVANRNYGAIRWNVGGSVKISIELVPEIEIIKRELKNANFANYLYNGKYIGGNNTSEAIQGIFIEENEYAENQGIDTDYRSYEANVGNVYASYSSDKDWNIESGRQSSLSIFNLRNYSDRKNINFLTLGSTIIIDGIEYKLGGYLSDIALYNVSDDEIFAMVRCVVYTVSKQEVGRNIGVFINKNDYSINRIKFISVVDNIASNQVLGWNADEIVKYNDVYYCPWYSQENSKSEYYNENAPEGAYIIRSDDLVNWTIVKKIIERPSSDDPGGSTSETSIYLKDGIIYFVTRWSYRNSPVCGTYDINNDILNLNKINGFNIGAGRPSLVVFNGNIYYWNIDNVNIKVNGIDVARCEPVLIKMDMNWNTLGILNRRTVISCSYSKLYAYKSHLLLFYNANFAGNGSTHPWSHAINRNGIYYTDITDLALNM